MKRIYPKLARESAERQSDAGRYNPSSIAKVRHKGRTYICVLSCGDSDSVHFWQDKDTVYSLCVNQGLGYCGLEAFALGETVNRYCRGERKTYEADKSEGPFLQADHEIEAVLGKRGLDLSINTIKNRLLEYLEA